MQGSPITPLLTLLTILFLLLFPLREKAMQETAGPPTPPEKAFALVELFTSESSLHCPAADKLMNTLEAEFEKEGKAVYFLNLHVNYWDYSGWTDTYANKYYTDRQDYYASYFPSGRSYTPQLVVNGQVEFIGSEEERTRKEIAAALSHKKPILFKSMVTQKVDSTAIAINYGLYSLPPNCSLYFALVEKNLPVSTIKSGENKGLKLAHYSVTRLLERSENKNLSGSYIFKYPCKEKCKKFNCSGIYSTR